MGHPEKFDNESEDLLVGQAEAPLEDESAETTESSESLSVDKDSVEEEKLSDENEEGDVENLEEEPIDLMDLEFDAVGEVFGDDITKIVEQQSESHEGDVAEAPDDSLEVKKEYSEKGGISSLVDKLPKGFKKAINVMMLTSILAGGMAVKTAEAGIKDDIVNVWKNTKEGLPLDYNKGDRKAYKDANKRAERYEKDRIKRYRKYRARRAGYYDGRYKAQQKAGVKYQEREIIQNVIFSVLGGR